MEEWPLVSCIKRSWVRRLVLEAVEETPKTPTEIASDMNIYQSMASRALIELANKGLVKCLNPGDTNGRLYRATRRGRELICFVRGNG